MGDIFYSMDKLLEIKESNALKAVEKFKTQQDYFDKLTDFIEGSRKFAVSYNPMVIAYSDDVRAEFMSEMSEVRKKMALLEIDFINPDLKSLEDAVHGSDPKSMQDELRKLSARIEIFAERVEKARSENKPMEKNENAVKYNIEELCRIEECNAIEAAKNFKTKQDYFDKLTEFATNAYKSLCSYNMAVVVYAEDIHNEFLSKLKELKDLMSVLNISMQDDLKNIEDLISAENVTQLSDELLKLNARMEIIAKRILSTSIEDTNENCNTANLNYDMDALAKFDEFDAVKAVKKFKSQSDFFDKLSEFVEGTKKFLQSYNPIVVIYGKEIREDFLKDLHKVKLELSELEMSFVDKEILHVEKALNANDVNTLSTELSRLNHKIEILTIKITSAKKSSHKTKPATCTVKHHYNEKMVKTRHDYMHELERFIDNSHKFLVSYQPLNVECDEKSRNTFLHKTTEIKKIVAALEKAFKQN